MNAEQARKNTQLRLMKKVENEFYDIMRLIERAIENYQFSVTISTLQIHTMVKLQNLGYTVRKIDGYLINDDIRFFEISWK